MANPGEYGVFIPTTQVWDVASLSTADVNSPEFKELLVRMYMNLNRMAIAINLKESGYYNNANTDFVDGNQWFPNPAVSSSLASTAFRPEYRTVVNFGALPNGPMGPLTKSIPHNLPVNASYTWTRIYATATDPVGLTGIPIPFASPTLTDAIAITVDALNVNITVDVTKDYSNYTICLVVLEYLKN